MENTKVKESWRKRLLPQNQNLLTERFSYRGSTVQSNTGRSQTTEEKQVGETLQRSGTQGRLKMILIMLNLEAKPLLTIGLPQEDGRFPETLAEDEGEVREGARGGFPRLEREETLMQGLNRCQNPTSANLE